MSIKGIKMRFDSWVVHSQPRTFIILICAVSCFGVERTARWDCEVPTHRARTYLQQGLCLCVLRLRWTMSQFLSGQKREAPLELP